MNFLEHIQSSHSVMLGKPVIIGTRITVEIVLKKLSEGASFQDIMICYPNISQEDIKACLLYASEVISHESVLED